MRSPSLKLGAIVFLLVQFLVITKAGWIDFQSRTGNIPANTYALIRAFYCFFRRL